MCTLTHAHTRIQIEVGEVAVMQQVLVLKVTVSVVMMEVTEKDQNSPRAWVFCPRTASPLVVNKTYLEVQMHY